MPRPFSTRTTLATATRWIGCSTLMRRSPRLRGVPGCQHGWSRGTTSEYFEQLDETLADLRVDIQDYRELGERVVALGVIRVPVRPARSRLPTISRSCSSSRTRALFASTSTTIGGLPSKPPGLRSRQCRGSAGAWIATSACDFPAPNGGVAAKPSASPSHPGIQPGSGSPLAWPREDHRRPLHPRPAPARSSRAGGSDAALGSRRAGLRDRRRAGRPAARGRPNRLAFLLESLRDLDRSLRDARLAARRSGAATRHGGAAAGPRVRGPRRSS